MSAVSLEHIVQQAGGRGLHGEAFDRAAAFMADWHCGWTVESEPLPPIGNCRATILLATSDRGLWIPGHDCRHPAASVSAGPSIWAGVAFRERADAQSEAIGRIRAFFQDCADDLHTCTSDAIRAHAARMVRQIGEFSPDLKQPDLFG